MQASEEIEVLGAKSGPTVSPHVLTIGTVLTEDDVFLALSVVTNHLTRSQNIVVTLYPASLDVIKVSVRTV